MLAVIKFAIGDSAKYEDKTEGPNLQLESIGWHVNIIFTTISPS